MVDEELPGDEAYHDPIPKGPGKVLGDGTFCQPIRTVGMRACVILGEEDTVGRAIESMRAKNIGSVLVTDSAGKLSGIFTERDALNKLALGEQNPKRTALRDVMKPKPDTLTLDDEIRYALRIMGHGGYRHVPLVDKDGRPVGVISVRDIVDFITDHFPDQILTLPSDPRAAIAKHPEGA
jgi:CBS domain-containing protein